jgi:nitroimidazol reductase NimA-like FMN-containing flavoprotein (pyridoxamine 5'-phosphate oxidase superfamily)
MQQAERSAIEHIEHDECLELLRGDEIGRLAIVDGPRPMIFPVNYVFDGDDIVIRTAPGTKIDHGTRSAACFEIDDFDREHQAGWSVVVTGRLEELTKYDGRHFARASELPVHPWAGGAKDHILRLVPASVTGRRIRGTR